VLGEVRGELREKATKLLERESLIVGQKRALDRLHKELANANLRSNGDQIRLEGKKQKMEDLERKNNHLELWVTRLVDNVIDSAEAIRELRGEIDGPEAEKVQQPDIIAAAEEGEWNNHDGSFSNGNSEDEYGYPMHIDPEAEYQSLLERKTDLEKKAYLLSVQLREKEKSLRLKDDEVSELKEMIEKGKRLLTGKDKSITEKDTQLANLNAMIENGKSLLGQKDKSITEKDARISGLNAAMDDLKKNFAEKDTQLVKHTTTIEALKSINFSLQSKLTRCQESLAQANDELESRDSELRNKDHMIPKMDELVEILAKTRQLLAKAEIDLIEKTSNFDIEIAAKNKEIECIKIRLTELEHSLSFRTLLQMRGKLAEKEKELLQKTSDHEAELAEKDKLLMTATTRLAESETALLQKKAEWRSMNVLLVEKIGQLSSLERKHSIEVLELKMLNLSSKLDIATARPAVGEEILARVMEQAKDQEISLQKKRIQVLESQKAELLATKDDSNSEMIPEEVLAEPKVEVLEQPILEVHGIGAEPREPIQVLEPQIQEPLTTESASNNEETPEQVMTEPKTDFLDQPTLEVAEMEAEPKVGILEQPILELDGTRAESRERIQVLEPQIEEPLSTENASNGGETPEEVVTEPEVNIHEQPIFGVDEMVAERSVGIRQRPTSGVDRTEAEPENDDLEQSTLGFDETAAEPEAGICEQRTSEVHGMGVEPEVDILEQPTLEIEGTGGESEVGLLEQPVLEVAEPEETGEKPSTRKLLGLYLFVILVTVSVMAVSAMALLLYAGSLFGFEIFMGSLCCFSMAILFVAPAVMTGTN